MAIQHVNIADADRHEAKGASLATAGQVLRANGVGGTSFVNPNTLANINISSTIEGISNVTQNPSGTDTAYQVTWGAGTSNSDVNIAASGVITFLTAGLYIVTTQLSIGRSTNVGTASLFTRNLVNDVENGFVHGFRVETSADVQSYRQESIRSFAVNDTLKVQFVRDSSGSNDGGLITLDPVISGWSNSPSAAIRIQKIAGGA